MSIWTGYDVTFCDTFVVSSIVVKSYDRIEKWGVVQFFLIMYLPDFLFSIIPANGFPV